MTSLRFKKKGKKNLKHIDKKHKFRLNLLKKENSWQAPIVIGLFSDGMDLSIKQKRILHGNWDLLMRGKVKI